MYVNIKKYPSRLTCTLYSDYMRKKHGYLWGETTTSFEKFIEKVDDIVQAVYNVINRAYFDRLERSIKVRIDPSDVWSMDSTLAHIIVPMLRQLKEFSHGSPEVDDNDVPSELEGGEARWSYVLDEMISAFEQKLLDDWQAQYFTVVEDDTAMFGIKITDTDQEGLEAHQARMTNGFRLFGKYYEALWD
jgi:uncharacterized damage-inducible protein DinB